MKKIYLFAIISLFSFKLQSQTPLSDSIFDKNITSVQIFRTGFVLSNPIIALASGDQLTLSFDEFGTKNSSYSYTITHCNANWIPSDYLKNEYLEPFTNEQINDVTYSNNTLKDYVHYEIVFPNINLQILKSGNYIVSVYSESEESPVLTKRFFVTESSSIPITAVVKQATDLSDRFKKQEIDVTIGKSSITNSSNVKLLIQQNGRIDNLISLKPSSDNGDFLVYDYDKENVFEGGAEFRGFDIKSIRYKLDHVQVLEVKENVNHAFLYADKQRSYQAYESLTDINGRQFFKTEDYDNQLTSEYVWVHFFIPMQPLLEPGTLYVFGALSQWKYLPEAILTYNSKLGGYQGALLLKQGYYNYQYVFVPKGKTIGVVEIMEGNHWETENEYTIFVYNRPDGAIADKLIGVKLLKSTH